VLGSWQQAQIGDLFAESDGVRTGTNSTASLAFIDGSQIVISQNTTAVVRTSRIDKLERTAQANITLIKGSLLSQLSQQAQESGSFKLSAGKAEAIIRSSKFWASVNEVSATRIANYEGTMEVKAGKMAVTLKKNQGTVVLKGKEPMPPVELLPAPRLQWNALDTVIFRSELLLRWNPVANTTKYQIEVSSERNFSENVQTYSTSATSFLLKNLPNETRFVRLQAFDQLGLRGADSPTYRILRSSDTEPPFIFVQDFPIQKGDTLTRYITLSQLDIQGETEPNATLLKDGAPIEVAPNGTFQFSVSLENWSEKFISLSAFDAAKNRRIELVATSRANLFAYRPDPFSFSIWLQRLRCAVPQQVWKAFEAKVKMIRLLAGLWQFRHWRRLGREREGRCWFSKIPLRLKLVRHV